MDVFENFKKRGLLHLLLTMLAGLGFTGALVLAILKLAEIGMGPELSWGWVIAGLVTGVLAMVLALFNMFKMMGD